jgi:hypothetical protein
MPLKDLSVPAGARAETLKRKGRRRWPSRRIGMFVGTQVSFINGWSQTLEGTSRPDLRCAFAGIAMQGILDRSQIKTG